MQVHQWGKDYFKKTGIAMGCIYVVLAIVLCVTAIVLKSIEYVSLSKERHIDGEEASLMQ